MADDLEDAEDERAIELSSVSAIYPELVKDDCSPYSATIDIPVEPLKPLIILFPSLAGESATNSLPTPPTSDGKSISVNEDSETSVRPQLSTNVAQDIHQLSHLPPLKLRVQLPDGYPSEKPPIFELDTEFSWLPQQHLQKLLEAGHTLWEGLGKDQVVFAYIDHLRDTAESSFGINLAAGEAWRVSSDLKIALLDYDIKAKREKFDRATYECGVCLGKIYPAKGIKPCSFLLRT